MKKELLESYKNLIKKQDLKEDKKQIELLKKLNCLKKKLENESGFIKNIFSKKKIAKSIWIYGGVGRGKSMLMDLFYESINIPKLRIHFHEFMSLTHRELHKIRKSLGGVEDPLKLVAKTFSKKAKILCFDEFQVTEVADAMILERLFKHLFYYGVFVVTTSNRHPENLYEGGIQREKYLEFVNYMQEQMLICELAGDCDYRIMKISSLKEKYFYPNNKDNIQKIENLCNELTGNSKMGEHILYNLGRKIIIKEAASNVAKIDFNEFCKGDYSVDDYREIAENFSTIFFINIPKLKSDEQNYLKRLINFIDICYDKKISVIFLSEVAIEGIYKEKKGGFEFQRTISRITEMSS